MTLEGRLEFDMSRPKVKNKRTPIEDQMAAQLREKHINGFRRNARFIQGRRFEADFWFPRERIALEVDGGVWMPKSGHTSGKGYTSDRERDVEALMQGILTIRYTSGQVKEGYAIETFPTILEARRKELGLDGS
jgi:very-short-patch-repair endonuclease